MIQPKPYVQPSRLLLGILCLLFATATFANHVASAAALPGTFGRVSTTQRVRPFLFSRQNPLSSHTNSKTRLGSKIDVPSSAENAVPLSVPSYLLVRGGTVEADDYDDYDDEYDEESDFDFDDEFGFEDGDLDAADDGFGEAGWPEQIMAAWQKTPPFTKGYLTASAAATALGYVTNGNQFPPIFLLEWKSVLQKLQIWRPFTAFLNVGPFGLGYIMTAQFVWTYMSTLERMCHNRPYDFWLMIIFGCATMVAGYSALNIPPVFLGHNLSTFLVYVWSRYHEGMEVSMFDLFNARAEQLPWMFLAQTFLLEGVFPTLDLLGILFGHIYHHLTTTNALKAPRFVINWYNGEGRLASAIREKYKQISSDFEMDQ